MARHRRRAAGIALAVTAACALAAPLRAAAPVAPAQPVHGAGPSPPAAGVASAPPPERELAFDLGLRYLAGPTDLRGVTGGFTWLRRDARLETIVDVDADYLATGDQVLRRYAQAAATADLFPSGRWSPFALATWTKDEVSEVDSRWQLGGGVKHVLADGPRGKHSLSLALLWEDQEPTRADLRHDESLFLSLRAKHRWRVGDHSELAAVAFWQPEVDDPGRYRAYAEASFDSAITAALSLVVEVSDEHDSRPVGAEVEENQLVSRLLLRYRRAAPAPAAGEPP